MKLPDLPRPLYVFFPLFILLLFPAKAFSQSGEIRFNVYFATDKHHLTGEEALSIDKALEGISLETVNKIILTGNTDSDADSLYNIILSGKRAATVRDYLISKGFDNSSITTQYQGENIPVADNTSKRGRQMNRRVEVLVIITDGDTALADEIAAPCFGDTVITLESGIQLTFSKCEYLKVKDCIRFTEAGAAQQVIQAGLSLMADDGIPLASCGMLEIKLNPGCTDKACFDVPVKIRFPVPPVRDCDFCRRRAGLWILVRDGWRYLNSQANMKTIEGRKYYEFEIDCPAWVNCDCKIEDPVKVKFKAPAGHKISHITISTDCPTVVSRGDTGKRPNISTVQFPCFVGENFVTASLVDRAGNTLYLGAYPLADLPKRVMFSKCRKLPGNITYKLGFIPVSNRILFRKYLLKPEIFEKQEPVAGKDTD